MAQVLAKADSLISIVIVLPIYRVFELALTYFEDLGRQLKITFMLG